MLVQQRNYRPNFEQFWQESMKDWHGNMPKRMIDDVLEEDFWAQAVKRKTNGQTDPYAERIFEQMTPEFVDANTVLEIGPGWGNYTFRLANCFSQVTCIDSSITMLDYLKSCFDERGNHRISYVHAKWEDIQQFDPHDVVIGINCFYRMLNIKQALRNMNNVALKRAVVGMTSGPIQPHYTLLEEKYGYHIKHPRRDYIDLLNILYELGIYAQCRIVPLERTYRYNSFDDLVAAQSKKVLNNDVIRDHIEEALQPFVTYEEGTYCYRHDFHAALISWTPVRKV